MDKRELYGLLYAFTMGDGSIFYTNKQAKNPIFIANTITDNRDYVTWRASILEHFTKVRVYDIDQSHRNRKNLLRTVTNTHPVYTKIHNRLYATGRKSIDPHQLKFMSWQFLAILYMDYGSVRKDTRCNATPQVQIATKKFSYAENMSIKLAIKEKLGIDFNVRKQSYRDKIYWYLVLPTKQYMSFIENIRPYIFDSFNYKVI